MIWQGCGKCVATCTLLLHAYRHSTGPADDYKSAKHSCLAAGSACAHSSVGVHRLSGREVLLAVPSALTAVASTEYSVLAWRPPNGQEVLAGGAATGEQVTLVQLRPDALPSAPWVRMQCSAGSGPKAPPPLEAQ